MKNLIIYSLLFVLVFNACTDDFDEIDRPKTTSEQIEPDYLFTRSLVAGSGLSVGVWQLVHQTAGSVYAQQFANIKPGFTSDNYEPGPGNTVWDWYYARNHFAPINLNYRVIELATNLENPVKLACARIWQVYMYQLITDMYGDIPYTDAFLSSKPKFDKQSDIYADLLKELKESMDLIATYGDKGYVGFNDADVLFNGDLTKWERFAGSLMMRIALRASNVAEDELTRTYLSQLDLGKTMQSNEDIVKVIPDADGPTYHVKNPMKYVSVWEEVRMSKTMYDMLDKNADPRLQVYAAPNEDGNYVGLENGQTQDNLSLYYTTVYQPKYCDIGEFFLQDETPHYLFTYAEACFLKAEAAQRGYISGNALEFYNQGLQASLTQFDITDTDVQNTFINGNAKFDASKGLEQIYEQRWLAFFPNGNEAWNLVRRVGHPVMNTPVYTWPDNPDMPRRMPYPVNERRYNEENYNAAVNHMGGDSQYTRVWWDGGN